ncbi:MAG: enoyl-CoA hydratase/isomerase family protein [Hyphomonadaceae bacterium]
MSEPSAKPAIRYEAADFIAAITLDRPERRNALTYQAYDELEAAFHRASEDASVRCVILTGADPGFCSGDDMREIMNAPKSFADLQEGKTPMPNAAALAVLHCAKPVIAAVNGAAIGWGMDLALFADMRIASERASFSEMFVRRGLVSDLGAFYCLPRLVGHAKAAELMFTGDLVDAAEALRIGLVSEVTPHAELLPRARALAARIAANPPLAVTALKAGLRRNAGKDAYDIGAWATGEIRRLMRTSDHKESVAAYLEKREPRFRGE